MSVPQVSILVPICNVQHYLRQCLMSLANQSLEDIEIICINDGSTDESLRIINEFASRDNRFVVINKANSGYGDSMNKGLELSRGKYIGIVESDDFAALHMFDRLYRVAVEQDADLVRSNFFAHSTINGVDHDDIIENLDGCPYDMVVRPVDYPVAFLCRPAIWTCLYKKSFLDKNKIRFLATPGASFQDTGFCFKALYAAERAFFIKDALLYYRVDNANSSVKSQKKTYCVCDEYAEIWKYAQSDSAKFEKIKYLIPRQQYGGYRWNLERLIPTYQVDFMRRFASEFSHISAAGLLDEKIFGESDFRYISQLIAHPDQFFTAHYAPIKVSRSVILLAYGQPFSVITNAVESVLAQSPDDIEYFLLHEDSQEIVRGIRSSDSVHSKSLFSDTDLFANRLSLQLDPIALRGSELDALILDDNTYKLLCDLDDKATPDSLVDFLTQISLPTSETNFLDSLLPIILSDRFEGSESAVSMISSLCTLFKSASDLTDEAFSSLSVALESEVNKINGSAASFNDGLKAVSRLEPLWMRCRRAYHELSFTDRAKVKDIYHSMETVPRVCCRDYDSEKTPQVSVIVPVYNCSDYLYDCLDSISSQQEIDFEIIAIDDGSTDDSLAMLIEASHVNPRLRIYHQPNLGVSAARNFAIGLAHGEYLAFIDSDDFYANRYALHLLYEAAKANDCMMCGGGFSLYNTGRFISESFAYNESHYCSKKAGFVQESDVFNDFGWIRFIYKRSMFENGQLRFPDRSFYEDPVFFLQAISIAHRYYVIPDVIYRYRVGFKRYNWSVQATRDILKGIQSNLRYAEATNNPCLYSTLVDRINWTFFDAIMENIADDEVMILLASLQANLNASLFNEARDKEISYYVLRPLIEVTKRRSAIAETNPVESFPASPIYNEERKTAIARLASRIDHSKIYTGAQSLIWRVKDIVRKG